MKRIVIQNIRNLWGAFLAPPRQFEGTLLLNQLGYQIFRIGLLNIPYWILSLVPRKGVAPYAGRLKNEGAVIVPNFLPEDVYKKLMTAYSKGRQEAHFKPLTPSDPHHPNQRAKVAKARLNPQDYPELYEIVEKHFLESTFLKRLGSVATRYPIRHFKTPVVFIHKMVDPTGNDEGPVTDFHHDSPYPSIKMFYYLNNIDRSNGAFTYARGTHRLSWARLRYEYRKSIVWAKNQARDPNAEVDETGAGFLTPSEKEREQMNIVGTPMAAPTNSMVIFNTMGFHKRGSFSSTTPREILEISYRR